MTTSERKRFGAYDRRATLYPSYDPALRFDVIMGEEPPLEDKTNRRFVGTLSCQGEIIGKRAEYHADELLGISPMQHFLHFAKALEATWQDENRRPKRRGTLRVAQ